MFLSSQVTIVEKADSSGVLPSPLSISTKSKMTFLFANLKDRDFLVQRISDFLQKMPSKQPGSSRAARKTSIADPAPEVRGPLGAVGWGSGPGEELRQPQGACLSPGMGRVPARCSVGNAQCPGSQASMHPVTPPVLLSVTHLPQVPFHISPPRLCPL